MPKPGTLVFTRNPRTEKVETGGSLGLNGQSAIELSPRPTRDPVSKIARHIMTEKWDPRLLLFCFVFGLHMHTHKHA